MDIQQESVQEFVVGHGGAESASKPIVAAGHARKAYKSIRVRAATANTIAIYVGPAGVTTASGYPLPASEELEVKIEDPSRIHVVAAPAGNSQQVVTISGDAAGDTFTLTGDGGTTDPIDANAAAAATVETALEDVYGAGNVSVAGDAGGPYTVEYIGDLAGQDVTLMVGTGIGANEQQTVEITDGAVGDVLTLTYDGVDGTAVPYGASAAILQAVALETIPALAGNVSVSGAGPYVVTFLNDLAATDVDALTGVCGRDELQTITITGGEAGDMLVLTYDAVDADPVAYDADAVALQAALETIPALTDNVLVDGGGGSGVVQFIGSLSRTNAAAISGVCGKNEKQTISLDESVTGGTFTLEAAAEITAGIAFDADGAGVQSALELLANIGAGQVSVTGPAGGPWEAEFNGTLARTDVVELIGDGTNLVGEIKTVTVVETVKGHAAVVAVEETVQGRAATVTVTETQAGHANPTVAVTKTDASAGSQYSWIAV